MPIYELTPFRQALFWITKHVFNADVPLAYTGSSSLDRAINWILALILAAVATLLCAIWSTDRRAQRDRELYAWARLLLRFTLAAQLIGYGCLKIIPVQMRAPDLSTLVEPFGDFSPMGVLWASMGSAPVFEMFGGWTELIAGTLLTIPRLTMLGALLCVADMSQVLVLNIAYDVPIKLYALHLLLLAVFLLWPEMRRFADFFLFDKTPTKSVQFELFQTFRSNRRAQVFQAAFGLFLIISNLLVVKNAWHLYGPDAPKSPLYGIWTIQHWNVNRGEFASPWQRVIFNADPHSVQFQNSNGSLEAFRASIDGHRHLLRLVNADDTPTTYRYAIFGTSHLRLVSTGTQPPIKVQLERLDLQTVLREHRSGIHWIQARSSRR